MCGSHHYPDDKIQRSDETDSTPGAHLSPTDADHCYSPIPGCEAKLRCADRIPGKTLELGSAWSASDGHVGERPGCDVGTSQRTLIGRCLLYTSDAADEEDSV